MTQLASLFVCPCCHRPLNGSKCTMCGITFSPTDGCIDFVVPDELRRLERAHYDSVYGGAHEMARPFDRATFTRRWHDWYWPECQLILNRLGHLRDKVVVAVGNGAGTKELHFLQLGAYLIYSDLSLQGPRRVQLQFDLSRFQGRYAFHAFDACAMPLPNNSVDVVYAFELVHHLPDVDRFLDEVSRVLKPGGRCVFFDHAYSPLWQAAKRSILWPLMKLSHAYNGISPEDLRATYRGGYREDELARWAARHDFSVAFCDRTTFFQYLLTYAVGSLIGWRWPLWVYKGPAWIGRALDRVLTSHIGLLRRSRIEMVWGFHKV